MLLLKQQ